MWKNCARTNSGFVKASNDYHRGSGDAGSPQRASSGMEEKLDRGRKEGLISLCQGFLCAGRVIIKARNR